MKNQSQFAVLVIVSGLFLSASYAGSRTKPSSRQRLEEMEVWGNIVIEGKAAVDLASSAFLAMGCSILPT